MITVIILCKNEENNIIGCLNSLEWSDEIIIVDDYSNDATVELVKSLNNKKITLYQRHLENDFSAQRNYGLQKAKGDWVLFVDSDERVSESLQYEIVGSVNTSLNNISGFYIKRVDHMWGKRLRFGEPSHVKLLRLGRKEQGLWIGKVHERWEVSGKLGELKNNLIHYPHPDTVTFLKEINFYTNLRSEELYYKNIRTNMYSIIVFPLAKFIMNFILRLGFLDGVRGLLFAVMMSFHSFLVRGKLWWLWEKKKVNK